MEIEFKGKITKLQAVDPGSFFVFRVNGKLAFGMKISSDLLDDPRQILMFHLADTAHGIRIFDSTQAPNPTFVYCVSAKLVFEPMPDDLREGVMNPAAGTIYVTEASTLLGVYDTSQHDFDPVLVDVETGAIRERLKENAAAFSKWRIVVKVDDREINVLSWPLPSAPAQVG